uniref:Uncharacterized protein n=1 Tax=uncultured marine virus TaxID=186617 RepID=A0A0F7L6U3_9VIRU|nr:hypothetical protein [uncultured marine virus]
MDAGLLDRDLSAVPRDGLHDRLHAHAGYYRAGPVYGHARASVPHPAGADHRPGRLNRVATAD